MSSEPSPGCDAAWPIYAESIYGDDTDGSFLANIENMVRSKLNLGEKLFYQNMFLPLKEFSSNLETLWQFLNEGEALDWYWNVNGEVGPLAMVLTRIEWYLKAIFGKNLDRLNDLEDLIGFSGELYAPLGKHVTFYNGRANTSYSDFCTMAFKKLHSQVEAAPKQI